MLGSNNPQYKHGLEQYRTYDWLFKKYHIEGLSLSSISKLVGVDVKTIQKWLIKVDIPRRPHGSRIGKFHHSFKGSTINSQGYRLIYSPNHPRHDSRNYVREHILIAETALGRFLNSGEVIHHINADKLDNRLENLYLMSKRAHDRHERLNFLNSPKFVPIIQSNLSMS